MGAGTIVVYLYSRCLCPKVRSGLLTSASLDPDDPDVFERIRIRREYFLSGLQAGAAVYDEEGQRTAISELLTEAGLQDGEAIEGPVLPGAERKPPVRLIARKVPRDATQKRREKLEADAQRRGRRVSAARIGWARWTIYVTDAPRELPGAEEALVMAKAGWQIEQLFRLRKSEARIGEPVSVGPYRRLCEMYAKPIGAALQHWMMLVGCREYPDGSLIEMARVVRSHAMSLAGALAQQGVAGLARAILN